MAEMFCHCPWCLSGYCSSYCFAELSFMLSFSGDMQLSWLQQKSDREAKTKGYIPGSGCQTVQCTLCFLCRESSYLSSHKAWQLLCLQDNPSVKWSLFSLPTKASDSDFLGTLCIVQRSFNNFPKVITKMHNPGSGAWDGSVALYKASQFWCLQDNPSYSPHDHCLWKLPIEFLATPM